MITVSLVFLSALAFALSAVLVRKYLDKSNVFSASLIVMVTGNIILWPLTLLFSNIGIIRLEGVILFVIAGIFEFVILKFAYYKGIETVGVSVAGAVLGTHPLFSSILALLFLNEVLTPANWIGIICTVIGVVLIQKILRKPNIEVKKIGKGLIFPILAALTLALSLTFKKYGLTIYDEPLLSVSIGYFAAFPFYALLLLFSSSLRSSFSFSKDFRLFWKAGVCMAAGVGLISFALSFERLSIVAPLLQLEPLFILFFSYVILRELESISSKLVVSTVLIVFGAILVSIN